MTIDQLLSKRNATDISLCQLNTDIIGVQCHKVFSRGECECDCDGNEDDCGDC